MTTPIIPEEAVQAAEAEVRREALEEAAIDELRLKAFKTNSEADREAYFDAVSKWFQDRHLRALSANPAPSEDDTERGKFYHKHWPMGKLLEARRGGLVDHSGGEAWRYEYTHKDENGEYDMLYRRLAPKHKVVTPPEGGE